MSRPTRARGLKRTIKQSLIAYPLSRPTRARGLKLVERGLLGFERIGRAPRGRVD